MGAGIHNLPLTEIHGREDAYTLYPEVVELVDVRLHVSRKNCL
jgi:hypothetical protein